MTVLCLGCNVQSFFLFLPKTEAYDVLLNFAGECVGHIARSGSVCRATGYTRPENGGVHTSRLASGF